MDIADKNYYNKTYNDSNFYFKNDKKKDLPWFLIGITTAPRKNDTNYLSKVLESYNKSLNYNSNIRDYKKTKVLVFNSVNPIYQKHIVYDKEKERYKFNPNFVFHENYNRTYLSESEILNLYNRSQVKERLYSSIRKIHQTNDIISLVDHLYLDYFPTKNDTLNKINFFMFAEDDAVVCKKTIYRLIEIFSKFQNKSDFLLGSMGFGHNGIIFKFDHSLISYKDFLKNNKLRKPCDHLLNEFKKSGDNKKKTVLRQKNPNFFIHIGKVSSLNINKDKAVLGKCIL